MLAARFLLTGEAAHTVRLNRRYHVRRDYSEPAGAPTFWGGYSGIFLDPEGHPWEVAHNPSWTLTEDGRTLLGS